MGGAEVGTVAAEDLDPLRACLVDARGDEVGGVAVPAAGHADVRRGGAGGFADDQVGVSDGVALGAVDGGGVGQLDVGAGVLGREGARSASTVDREVPGAVDAGDRPLVTVGDAEVAVVAAGADPVADADVLAAARGDVASWRARRRSICRSRTAALRAATCSRVSAMTWDAGGGFAGDLDDSGEAFDLGGVDDDLAPLEQRVEHLVGTLAGAHEQGEVGVRRGR